MTDQSWQAALNPTLLQRLLRPGIQSGCIDRRMSEVIIARYQRLAHQLPLLPRLLQRQTTRTGFEGDSLPIVYAQQVQPQPDPVIGTSNLSQSNHYQTIYQIYNKQPGINQTVRRKGQTGEISIYSTQINQNQNNQAPIYQNQSSQPQGKPVSANPRQTERNKVQPAQRPQSVRQSPTPSIVIQTKLVDSASLSDTATSQPQTSDTIISPDQERVVAEERSSITVFPLQIEWVRPPLLLAQIEELPLSLQRIGVQVPASNSATMPLVIEKSSVRPSTRTEPLPIERSHPSATGSSLPVVHNPSLKPLEVQVPASNSLEIPLVMENSSVQPSRRTEPLQIERSHSRPGTPPLPIVQVSSDREAGKLDHGKSSFNPIENASPLVFAVSPTRAVTQPTNGYQREGEPFMPPSAQTSGLRTGTISNRAPTVNGQIANGSLANGNGQVAPLSVEPAITAEQVKRLVDVEAIADKVEHQLMRRLAVEHERRGWTR
jgi:hypothetical protein